MVNILKKTKQNSDSQPNVLELGTRSLNKQHTNRTMVIPKIALAMCGYKGNGKMSADVKLIIQSNGEKFIKITPILKGVKKC